MRYPSILIALVLLPSPAVAQEATLFLARAQDKHIEQRSKGLHAFDATFKTDQLPGVDHPVSLTYSWKAPSQQQWGLDQVPQNWRKVLKDSLNDCWREISGILLFDLMANAKELQKAEANGQPQIIGKLPWASFQARFDTKRGHLTQVDMPKIALHISYGFTRIGDRVRLRQRKVRFGKHKLNLTYGRYMPINGFLLPTRITLGFGEGIDLNIRYTRINAKEPVPGILEPKVVDATIKSFKQDWKGWDVEQRIDGLKGLSELPYDKASALIARLGLPSRALGVRKAAIIALGQMKRRNVTQQLCIALGKNAKRPATYRLIARSLGQIGDPAAVKTLSLDWNQHKAAGGDGFGLRIHALGNIRHVSAVDALMKYFVKIDGQYVKVYQHVIISALERLTGKDFGKDTKAWRRWWRKNRSTFQFKSAE